MLTLAQAKTILDAALAHGRSRNFKPLVVAVLDARGALRTFVAEDGNPLKRADIAIGKAHGCLAMGVGARALVRLATERPHFIIGATHAIGGSLVPVPGGVLIRDGSGALLGAIGVSGDTSDNDELAAVAGIEAAGLVADVGA